MRANLAKQEGSTGTRYQAHASKDKLRTAPGHKHMASLGSLRIPSSPAHVLDQNTVLEHDCRPPFIWLPELRIGLEPAHRCASSSDQTIDSVSSASLHCYISWQLHHVVRGWIWKPTSGVIAAGMPDRPALQDLNSTFKLPKQDPRTLPQPWQVAKLRTKGIAPLDVRQTPAGKVLVGVVYCNLELVCGESFLFLLPPLRPWAKPDARFSWCRQGG